MRKLLIITAMLAATLALVGTDTFAAGERHVNAEFSPLAASGVSGRASLTENAAGETHVVIQLKGLTPDTEYLSEWYTGASCAEGTPASLGTFKSNPAGIAVFNTRVSQDLSQIGSISVKLGADMSMQACATVPE